MTRWGVERTPRTAYQPTPVPPAGVSALMPPPSQGAERRTERHTPRIRSRWGLRALVIGGLAGAAWLLTGAAAHAADRVPAPEGDLLGASSLVGLMQHGDDAIPVVTRVLRAAARPPEPSHYLRIPDLVQEPVVGVLTEVTNGSTEALVRGIAGAVGHGRFGATSRHHTAVEADAPEAVRAAPDNDAEAPTVSPD